MFHKKIKNYKPLIANDGSVHGTGLQNVLKSKIGAKIMLTQNLRTSDGLTNGAFGEILGFELKLDGSLKVIHVNFYNEKVGRETRETFPELQTLYNGKHTTPIHIHERIFNIGNDYSSTSATAISTPKDIVQPSKTTMDNTESRSNIIKCGNCDFETNKDEEMNQHLEENHLHACDHCEILCNSEDILRKHKRETHQHYCVLCKEVFSDAGTLNSHFKETHACMVCKKVSKDKNFWKLQVKKC